MIGGNPLRYYLHGMPGTYRQNEFIYNYWDYAFRGLLTTVIAAKALGNNHVVKKCTAYLDRFETITGDTGREDAEKMMKKVKRKNT